MVRCISIFTGAGGLDVGARKAGADIVACVENDADSAETLRLNRNGHAVDIVEDDIKNVDFSQWYDDNPQILIGGPPCQPFSKNGYWVRNDNRLIQDDPRNLLGQFIRALAEMRPKAFLFENVESILHPTNKDEIFRFVTNAEALGYKCTQFRTNAADFGVPQKRKRVFVFGVLGATNAIPCPKPTHSDHSKKAFDDSLPDYVGVGTFISKFDRPEFAEPQEDASQGTYFHELRHVPAGKNYIALSKLRDYDGKTFRSGGRFWNFLHKLHPNLPSITIAAQPGPWVGPFHWSDRRLRVPEIAAIQTFPEDYKFHGNRRSIQKQIGNAVPCDLAEEMIGHLLEKAL